MPAAPDVLVVGGGAIGSAVALAVAERGLSVLILEAGRVGRGASWAAAGLLAAEWSEGDPPALKELATASIALWPEWIRGVEERSGVGVSYRRDPMLNFWVDPDAPNLPDELATEMPPLGDGEQVSEAEARRLEPVVTGPIAGAVLDRCVAQVDNPRLTPALLRAGLELGVECREGARVVGLTSSGGRCTGVHLAEGTELAAGAVVIAAGTWSGLLAEASGLRLPVVPRRGQMLLFDAPMRPIRHVVLCGEMVLIPRPHGPLIVGTTYENVGFDCRVTLGGLAQILARADRIVPGLAQLPLARTWAGLRPGTPDQLPYLGPVPGWEGLYCATGHGRKGLTLAPITAQLVSRMIVDGQMDERLSACLPGRIVN